LKRNYTTLTQAARDLDSHPAALRKTINRFGIVERDGGQRVIPNNILTLFHRTKVASGYLYPAWVRTHDDLIAAAAEIPASIKRALEPLERTAAKVRQGTRSDKHPENSKGLRSRQDRGVTAPLKEKELA
jgi:hypothetical protein